MLKVGALNYLNAMPFFTAFECQEISTDATFSYGPPTTLNRALAQGDVDLAIISSVEFLRHQDFYRLVPPGYGISAVDAVRSVRLYLPGTLADLDKKVIAVPTDSASSVELVRILCTHFWGVSCTLKPFIEIEDIHEGQPFLLIGDQCLQYETVEGMQSIDLAEIWYKKTGLPFTFAILADSRKAYEQKEEEMKTFQKQLTQALKWSRENRLLIEQLAQKKLPLPLSTIQEYFSLLQYSLTDLHIQGLREFELLASVP